jgi:hypothetical protein
MVIKRLAAGGTMIAHLEVSAEELLRSATGAAQRQSAPVGEYGTPIICGAVLTVDRRIAIAEEFFEISAWIATGR